VQDISKTGKKCILDIEMEGVKNVKKSDLDARYVFIKPPSLSVLEKRLRARGTDTDEAIAYRLQTAEKEIKFSEEKGVHDKIVLNDDLDKAYEELEEFCLQD